MEEAPQLRPTHGRRIATQEKAGGATYTPKVLADFVARQIVEAMGGLRKKRLLRVLDPAVGHGELLVSLLDRLADQPSPHIEVFGFETDPDALDTAKGRLEQAFPDAVLHFESSNFLEFVLAHFGTDGHRSLFGPAAPEAYDLIIANPPYVRTQIMGAAQAQLLSDQFGLAGRVDLYHAFVLAISQALGPQGVAGVIVSNRFMTTRSGASVRRALFERFKIHHVWDLGDTKLFDAAVLPAVLLLQGKGGQNLETPGFTSIYQTDEPATKTSSDAISALAAEGVIKVTDGRRFEIQHGTLNTGVTPEGLWRIATPAGDNWLATVEAHSSGTFRHIGKVRVGVKTCADKVFIRSDWGDMAAADRPELLKPLTTHHVGRHFRALSLDRPRQILYPHEVVQGRRRAVCLSLYPRSRTYFEIHRVTLEGRRYVLDAGREWYEIWVPQDPDAWEQPKLVFRDIAEEPTFWIDLTGSVVNGDCYWLVAQNASQTDLLWLAAAIGNSTFIKKFYDLRFHNKLYAGRRRFITQYVEQFPLPDPRSSLAKAIVATAKQIYDCTPSQGAGQPHQELDSMVWRALTGYKAISKT